MQTKAPLDKKLTYPLQDAVAIGQNIARLLACHPAVKLGILFGSLAKGHATPDSDLDLGVAAGHPLGIALKTVLIEELAQLLGRPVDLVDLQTASGVILQQVLVKGTLIYCTDHVLYATLIRKMLFNQSDMMPYHDRILAERRKAWIGRL
jgi:predicted nucleotidyltransferase